MSKKMGMLDYGGKFFPLDSEKSKVGLSMVQKRNGQCRISLSANFAVEPDVAAQSQTNPVNGVASFRLQPPITWSSPAGMKFEQSTWDDPVSSIYSGIHESSVHDQIEFKGEQEGLLPIQIDLTTEWEVKFRVTDRFRFTGVSVRLWNNDTFLPRLRKLKEGLDEIPSNDEADAFFQDYHQAVVEFRDRHVPGLVDRLGEVEFTPTVRNWSSARFPMLTA